MRCSEIVDLVIGKASSSASNPSNDDPDYMLPTSTSYTFLDLEYILTSIATKLTTKDPQWTRLLCPWDSKRALKLKLTTARQSTIVPQDDYEQVGPKSATPQRLTP